MRKFTFGENTGSCTDVRSLDGNFPSRLLTREYLVLNQQALSCHFLRLLHLH